MEGHSVTGTRTARRSWVNGPILIWLAVAAFSQLGDAVWGFTLGWTGSAFGGVFAGSVEALFSTLIVVSLLFGGVAGDRTGQRRLLIRTLACSIGALIGFLVAVTLSAPLPVVLVFYAIISATIEGYRTPSEIVFIRQFVEPAEVPRAMSASTSLSLIAAITGPGLAGLLIAQGGLPASIVFNIVSFALVLLALTRLHPRHEITGTTTSHPILADLREGLTSLAQAPSITALVASLSLLAAGLLPVSSLLIPLLARYHGWSSGTAGAIVMASSAGSLLVATLLATFGPRSHARRAMLAGAAAAFIAVAAMALGPSPWLVGASALLCGAGVSYYTGHLSPLFVLLSSHDMQSRFSSVLAMAQALPNALASLALGTISQHWGTPTALLTSAAFGAAALIPLAVSSTLGTTLLATPHHQ